MALPPDERTVEVGPPPPDALKPLVLARGSRLGRYVVLGVLGAGGMGDVYLAVDPELGRKVALKLVKPRAAGDDGAWQARLLREAQAMAKSPHPNVVSVFDVGHFEGRLFLAMEYVDGRSLTEWLGQEPRSWRAVATVFAEAGAGLAAAHDAGLVHRDFKPDNVLIGNDGRVRVADFGLARAAETAEASPVPNAGALLHSPMTQVDVVLGTLAYMAPEQLGGGPANAQSDQFSFCVSLYRALYGRPPFAADPAKGTDFVEAVRAGAVPARPAGSRVPEWLHDVVVRGLRVAPEARFSSMSALVAELRRDPGRQRRRALGRLALAAGVLAAVATGAWLVHRQGQRCLGGQAKVDAVWSAERRATLARTFASLDVPYAKDVWRSLQAGLDAYGRAWVEQYTQTCEATWVRGDQPDTVLTLRMRCLTARLDELRSLSEALTKTDAHNVAGTSKALEALTDLSQCADVTALERRMPLPKTADAIQKVEALEHTLREAVSLFALGRFHEAQPLVEQVVAGANAVQYPLLQGAALKWLIRVNGNLGQFEHLREWSLDAIAFAEVSGDDRTRFEALLFVAQALDEFGAPLDEMLTFCSLAEAVLARIKGNAWYAAKLHAVVGNINLERGRTVEALEAYRRQLEVTEHEEGDVQEMRASAVTNGALALQTLHRTSEALAQYQRALALVSERQGARHPANAHAYVNLANLYLELNQPALALSYAEQGVALRLESLGPTHVQTADAMSAKGAALAALGRFTEAEQLHREALSIALGASQNNPLVPEVRTALGRTLLLAGRPRDALAAFGTAVGEYHALELAHPVEALVGAVEALVALGRLAEADTAASALLAQVSANAVDPSPSALWRLRFAAACARWPTAPAVARALAEAAEHDLEAADGEVAARLALTRQWLSAHRL